MYLALERPWARGAAPSAPVVAEAAPDAGVPARRGKRRARGGGRSAIGAGESELEPAIVLTDADRRLEWRGDAVELPPRRVDMEGGDEGRPLAAAEIQGALDRDAGAMLSCIGQATGPAPLTGTITLKLLVDPSGRPVRTRVQAPAYLFEHGLLACARRAAQSLGFPATGAHTVVTAPFELN